MKLLKTIGKVIALPFDLEIFSPLPANSSAFPKQPRMLPHRWQGRV